MSPSVLALTTPDNEFVLDTDASADAIGAKISQIQDVQEKHIAYGSLSLSAEQQRYCTTRKELLAVVYHTHVTALPVWSEVHCANGPPQFDMVAELQMPL